MSALLLVQLLFRCMRVSVCSVFRFQLKFCSLLRYSQMVTTVKRTFARIAPHGASSQATSSTDWTYCAFIEQLQRIAEQLSARIQGILVGALVCTMFHIILQASSTAIRTCFLMSFPRRVLPAFTERILHYLSPHQRAGLGHLPARVQGHHQTSRAWLVSRSRPT